MSYSYGQQSTSSGGGAPDLQFYSSSTPSASAGGSSIHSHASGSSNFRPSGGGGGGSGWGPGVDTSMGGLGVGGVGRGGGGGGGMNSMGSMGSMVSPGAVGGGVTGQMVPSGGFWTAFTTGGYEGEPGLLEELGINFSHIIQKSQAVLNPMEWGHIEQNIMDDADLAGPLIFVLMFAVVLLASGKPLFSNIYGLLLLGTFSIYLLLNLMSVTGIDAYRTASVLGYCLLPLVIMGSIGVVISLDGVPGYILSSLSIAWSTHSSSNIFVSVLSLSDQRLLVAYPLALFYASFAILSVFDVGTGKMG